MTPLSSSTWWLFPSPLSSPDEVAQCPAEMGSDLAHIGNSTLAWRVLEADSKSLAGRAKGTSLTQDRDGTGGKDGGTVGAFGLAGRSPLWRGTQRSLLSVSCNKTSPTEQDMTGWSGVGNPAGHKVTPCSSPSSCPTHLQGIVEDGDTWVIQAGI